MLMVDRDPRQSCAMGIMAKAPQAGRSKTRLCPPLEAEQAAMLSEAFLRDIAENILAAGEDSPVQAYAAFAPAGAEEQLRGIAGEHVRLVLADGAAAMPEGVEGFGKCLLQACLSMLGDGHPAACVISSDCPTLPTRLLRQAAEILLARGDRAVLGPACDGGYYLLGVKAPHAALFQDIRWSSAFVAEETRQRAHAIGLELIELDVWYDVDDAASLVHLLNDATGYPAPWTRRAMAAMKIGETMLEPAGIG